MNRLSVLLVAAGCFSLAGVSGAAVVGLSPNTGVTSIPSDGSTFTGTFAASTTVTLVNTLNPTESASVTEQVYRSGGTLDFYYQITNTGTGDALNTVELGKFTGTTTSVAYLTSNGGTIVPVNAPGANVASRTATGDLINFFFQSAGSGGQFPAGTTTDYLEVDTNATLFDVGGFGAAIDGGAAQGPGLFEPVAVPEPASLGLLAVAGAAAVGRRRSRGV
jgi:hypothetical protein